MDVQLAGKTVLVTGAGQGLGRVLAQGFAREGAHVVFHYLRSDVGAREGADWARREFGVRASAIGADISDPASVERFRDQVHEEVGELDILVNNAAYTGEPELFLDSDPDDWAQQLNVTLRGSFLATRAFLPDLIASTSGSIINIAGESGRVGESHAVVTSATRAGTLGFTKALAKEVARHKVRVNAVTLGLLDTATSRRTVLDKLDESLVERMKKAYPLRRFGDPDDVVPVVLLLASPVSAWVTGQTYAVNGGYAMIS